MIGANLPRQRRPAQLWSRIVTRALKGEPFRALPREQVLAADAPVPSRVADRRDEESSGGIVDRILRTLRGGSAETARGRGLDKGFPGDER